MFQQPKQLNSFNYDSFRSSILEKLVEVFDKYMVQNPEDEFRNHLVVPQKVIGEYLVSSIEVDFIVGQLILVFNGFDSGITDTEGFLCIPLVYNFEMSHQKTQAALSALTEALSIYSDFLFSGDGSFTNSISNRFNRIQLNRSTKRIRKLSNINFKLPAFKPSSIDREGNSTLLGFGEG